MPRVEEAPPRRLTDDEVKRVVALPRPLGWVCRLGLASGLRWGEMCRALVSDIRQGVLTVHRTKSGRMRRVPLPEDILLELRQCVGKIIPYAESSRGSFNRDVKRKAHVPDFHVHRLRHTFACRFLERGGNLVVLQELLGHASIRQTQQYARLTDELVIREARRVMGANRSRHRSNEFLTAEEEPGKVLPIEKMGP